MPQLPEPGTRRVLITGGASGLGLALAQRFVARGDRVVIGDLAPTAPAGLPASAEYLTLDVRSDRDWESALAWVTTEWGGLDVLVSNAGVATGGRIDVESFADWQRVLEINLLGVVRGIQTFVPMMKNQGHGHLVNTASVAGLVHTAGMSSYNTAKAGVVALSETLRYELRPFGIAVSMICPSFFRTNLGASFQGKDEELERAGARLIEKARYTVDQVADEAMKGIDAQRYRILPDPFARQLYWSRRLATPVFERVMAVGGTRLARRGMPKNLTHLLDVVNPWKK